MGNLMAQAVDMDKVVTTLARQLEERKTQPKYQSMENYQLWLEQEWRNLLNSNSQNDEPVFQNFLEQHPCLLFDTVDDDRLIHHAVFSQPELPGFRRKYPDFLCISQNSVQVTVNLIEIEAPGKPWTTKSGEVNAKLTQALGQLRSWKVWFKNPLNLQAFQQIYDVPDWRVGQRQLTFRYALVYGRRSEALANEDFARQRAYLTQSDEFIMTYDRLRVSGAMTNNVTVKLDRKSRVSKVRIIYVPPTLSIGSIDASSWYKFSGFEDAVLANPFINEERKKYIIEHALQAFARAAHDNLDFDLKSV